jgi:hypothetical protein
MSDRTILNPATNERKKYTAIFDRYESKDDGRKVYLRLINVRSSIGRIIKESYLVDATTQGLVGSIVLGDEITFSAQKILCKESANGFYLQDFHFLSKRSNFTT